MDKPEVQEEILASFALPNDDPKWAGKVEVVKRYLTFADNNKRVFTDLRLHIGQRWLVLPRRGLDDIQDALAGAQDFLNEARVHAYTPPPSPPVVQPEPHKEMPRRKKIFDSSGNNGRKNRNQEFDE